MELVEELPHPVTSLKGILEERAVITLRMGYLDAYTHSEVFASLVGGEQHDLLVQRGAMRTYLRALERRFLRVLPLEEVI